MRRPLRPLLIALCLAMWLLPLSRFASAGALPSTERLDYRVSLLKLGVVDAVFELLAPDSETQSLRVHATTRGFASRIYPVDNRYTTRFLLADGFPIRYEKDVREAKFWEKLFAQYDQKHERAVYRLDWRDDPTRIYEQALPDRTHTIFSALYFLRQHDFGREPRISFYLDAKSRYWRATAERVGAEPTKRGALWKVQARFQPMEGGAEPRQSDLLTDNIVVEGSPLKLELLVTPTATYVTKMEYKAMGFHLSASLEKVDGKAFKD